MAEANRAYHAGDGEVLHRILNKYQEEVIEGESLGAELVRIIRQISHARERITAIEREMEALLVSKIAQLKRDAEEVEREGRNLLAELAASIRGQIHAAESEYRILVQELQAR
jgi:hypothetical protein